MEKFNLDIFTLKLAIGTVWLVSIFMFACGIYNIYPFVEELAKSSTWGVIVAIPTLIFSYTIGGIATYLFNTKLFKSKQNFIEIDNFLFVTKQKNEFITKRYENMRHQYEFFKTCIPTILFLGFSVIWTSVRVLKSDFYRGEKMISIGLGILTIMSSLIVVKMTSKLEKEITYFIKKMKEETLANKV
ncbi:hypothetical protein Q4Q34_10320 [Flavivirga abyssicola]|uniref:hypothetical protein n=1 Tax=Flavivirga abyssicola TaxID=3063533 RepID=UPI0026DF1269|nr:hypothetical protein [Flavivirga sp. MEBiC07777]WVK11619.1 hypothetical protein Q4Q34_10320 [Flavivirga sp. MEBiC07777]